jgi:signal transduction histidine kinase
VSTSLYGDRGARVAAAAAVASALGPFLIALAVVAVFVADTFLPWQGPLSALYVVTVLTAVLFFGRNIVWLVSAACVALDVASLIITGQSPVLFAPELTAIGVSAYLGLKIKSVEAQAKEARLQLAHFGRLRVLDEVGASIAHEVNQPLSAVVTNANAALKWLRNEPANEPEAVAALNRIVRDANRASDIIARIRGLVRRGSEERAVPTDVNAALRETLAMTRYQVAEARISLRTELAPGLPRILVDRAQLQQVILNLVVNAIDAMVAGEATPRTLVVRSEKNERGSVVFSVQDTGIGLAPAQLERLFEPFFTTKAGGMGMGLAISRSIVEAYGGSIAARAAAPRGALFIVSFPPARADQAE